MVRGALVVVIVVASWLDGIAVAQAEDPDTEVARRHFGTATALYEAGKYEEAIAEFEEARKARPTAAFDYNIARCYDRLGRWALAVEAYERYAASDPTPRDVGEVRERIAALKARLGAAPQPAQARAQAQAQAPVADDRQRTARARQIGGWTLAGVGAALVVVGGGMLALRQSAVSDLQRLNDTRMPFDPSLESKVSTTQISSGVLFGLGGALAVTGVVLGVLGRREARAARVLAGRF